MLRNTPAASRAQVEYMRRPHCLAKPVTPKWDVGNNYTLRRLALATPTTRISPGLLMQPRLLWPVASWRLVSC